MTISTIVEVGLFLYARIVKFFRTQKRQLLSGDLMVWHVIILVFVGLHYGTMQGMKEEKPVINTIVASIQFALFDGKKQDSADPKKASYDRALILARAKVGKDIRWKKYSLNQYLDPYIPYEFSGPISVVDRGEVECQFFALTNDHKGVFFTFPIEFYKKEKYPAFEVTTYPITPSFTFDSPDQVKKPPNKTAIKTYSLELLTRFPKIAKKALAIDIMKPVMKEKDDSKVEMCSFLRTETNMDKKGNPEPPLSVSNDDLRKYGEILFDALAKDPDTFGKQDSLSDIIKTHSTIDDLLGLTNAAAALGMYNNEVDLVDVFCPVLLSKIREPYPTLFHDQQLKLTPDGAVYGDGLDVFGKEKLMIPSDQQLTNKVITWIKQRFFDNEWQVSIQDIRTYPQYPRLAIDNNKLIRKGFSFADGKYLYGLMDWYPPETYKLTMCSDWDIKSFESYYKEIGKNNLERRLHVLGQKYRHYARGTEERTYPPGSGTKSPKGSHVSEQRYFDFKLEGSEGGWDAVVNEDPECMDIQGEKEYREVTKEDRFGNPIKIKYPNPKVVNIRAWDTAPSWWVGLWPFKKYAFTMKYPQSFWQIFSESYQEMPENGKPGKRHTRLIKNPFQWAKRLWHWGRSWWKQKNVAPIAPSTNRQ
jgi:hypothetical protein